MLTPDDVDAAFRMILGRPPESEAVIEAHLKAGSMAALRRALVSSEEFRQFYDRLEGGADPESSRPSNRGRKIAGAERKRTKEADLPEAQGILLPPCPVELDPAPEAADRLFARVAESWSAMGRTAPHWSVLTHDRFLPGAIEQNRDAFARSAEVEGLLVDAALERLPGRDPAAMTCLEIGCGVGRATRALADRFASVHGVDVSEAHLGIARSEFAAEGRGHVAFSSVGSVGDYAALPETDMLFTRIVLQHNPPPVQAAILRAVFGRLRPRGVALFQAVTHIDDYAYSVEDDLARGERAMEMHALPQPAIFALMAEAGLSPVEVQEDFAAGLDGPYRSHLFLAAKG